MIKPRKRLVNANIAALYVKTTYGITVAPATVRSWANRGRISSYGTGATEGRYDLNEVDAYVRKRVEEGDVAS